MKSTFHCLLLAAERERENPLAKLAGVPYKSLIQLAGQPILARVIEALKKCPYIARCLVLGPPWQAIEHHPITAWFSSSWLKWLAPDSSPSLSVLQGFARIPQDNPVLLTTADLAFPNPHVFIDFCRQAHTGQADVAIGVVPYPHVIARFPSVRRTVLNFSDGPFCTCNLFAFLTPQGRAIVEVWRHIEQERKHPQRLLQALGFSTVLRYLLGTLSTQELARQVEKQFKIQVRFIPLPYPEAAIDIDTEQDLALARSTLEESSSSSA